MADIVRTGCTNVAVPILTGLLALDGHRDDLAQFGIGRAGAQRAAQVRLVAGEQAGAQLARQR